MFKILAPRRLYWRVSESASRLLDATSGAESVVLPAIGLVPREKGEVVSWIGNDPGGVPGARVVRPFSHPRLVVHEVEAAQALLRYQLHELKGRRIAAWPRLIVHPLRPFADSLTDVERMVFTELGRAVGAGHVSIHTGAELDRHQVETFG